MFSLQCNGDSRWEFKLSGDMLSSQRSSFVCRQEARKDVLSGLAYVSGEISAKCWNYAYFDYFFFILRVFRIFSNYNILMVGYERQAEF
jgi:hypothetical protein